jgi:hypothetical protein
MTIDQQAVANLLVETLLSRLGDEIDLVFHYGSYRTGNTHRYSDYDVSYVPVHESTGDHITVAVGDVMCDLYPLHWSRLEGVANFKEPFGLILPNSTILHQRNDEAGQRFAALRTRQEALLSPEQRPAMLRLAQEIFQKTGYDYYLLHTSAAADNLPACRSHALRILGTVIRALPVLNQRLIDSRKLDQLLGLPRLPQGFADAVDALHSSTEIPVLLHACDSLLQATRDLLLAEQRAVQQGETGFPAAFKAGYPELKNMVQKIIIASERNDRLAVAVALDLLYREISLPLAQALTGISYGGFNSPADYEQDLAALGFPSLWPPFESGDWEELRRRCYAFDEQMQRFLTQHGVDLCAFATLDDLRHSLTASKTS